ncbi:S1 family peptidase [Pseudomonas syringae]|uniref:S1 family peptidase n=1 Tax=Pseudomonas syringae TaxID=317 RepID=UPI0003F6149D|nr:serine protease [Pseudomonas syringae]
MTVAETSRRPKFKPFTVAERKSLAEQAFNFFSPFTYEKNLEILGEAPTPDKTQPLSVQQFIKYLDKVGLVSNGMMLIPQIKGLLDAMEREGILVAAGSGPFVMAPKHYYSLKQLTTRERRGWTWLTPALGPDFLYSYFGSHTVHIIGDSDGQERGGTGWVISDRHILTCAHVLTGMIVRPTQHFMGLSCLVKRYDHHQSIDVGVIELAEPCLHVDSAIGFREPIIGEQLYVLGYPPVPMARESALILQGGEVVNERIEDYHGQEAFLYSAIARPGNSGGPIIARSGHILGIVTEDRFNPEHPHALFFAGTGTSTIARAIEELKIDVELPIETYD